MFPVVMSHAHLARSLAEQGVFEEGMAHGREAVRLAEALDHPFSLLWGFLGLANVHSTRGELGQSARLLERTLALCREWSMTTYIPVTTAALGHAYARSGQLDEGVSLLAQAVAAYEATGVGYCQSISVAQLADAYLLANQSEDARACAERTVMLARMRGERGYEAYALHILGEVFAHSGPAGTPEAKARYREALTLADELGMRPLAAHCHLGLGRLYRRTDKRKLAQENLTTASTMYREMGMTYWLEQVEREVSHDR